MSDKCNSDYKCQTLTKLHVIIGVLGKKKIQLKLCRRFNQTTVSATFLNCLLKKIDTNI